MGALARKIDWALDRLGYNLPWVILFGEIGATVNMRYSDEDVETAVAGALADPDVTATPDLIVRDQFTDQGMTIRWSGSEVPQRRWEAFTVIRKRSDARNAARMNGTPEIP